LSYFRICFGLFPNCIAKVSAFFNSAIALADFFYVKNHFFIYLIDF